MESDKKNILIEYTKWLFKWLFILMILVGIIAGGALYYSEGHQKQMVDVFALSCVNSENGKQIHSLIRKRRKDDDIWGIYRGAHLSPEFSVETHYKDLRLQDRFERISGDNYIFHSDGLGDLIITELNRKTLEKSILINRDGKRQDVEEKTFIQKCKLIDIDVFYHNVKKRTEEEKAELKI